MELSRKLGGMASRWPAGKFRGAALAFVLLFLSLTVSVGVLELAVRVFLPQPTKISVPAILDQNLIYRLPAHAKGTDVKEEFAVRIETNSLGLRDREYAPTKPNGVERRILVLGDSMTFAEGVESEQTFPNLLEDKADGQYEVINAAIRGYGTDQEFVSFEQLIPVYRPDVALLAFFAFNDVDDNLYGGLFNVQGNQLVRRTVSQETSPKYRYYRRQSFIQTLPGYGFLIQHSHLVNLARQRWAWFEFHNIFKPRGENSNYEARAWRLTRELLTAWVELCRRERIQPLILVIPSWGQIYEGNEEPTDRHTQRVLSLARALDIPSIDPRETLRAAARGPDLLYYPKDKHMTPKGHEVVADYLQTTLSLVTTAKGTHRCVHPCEERL